MELCERAIAEQDPNKLLSIVQELIQVLEDEEKDERPSSPTGIKGDSLTPISKQVMVIPAVSDFMQRL